MELTSPTLSMIKLWTCLWVKTKNMFDYALTGALKPRLWTYLVVLTVKVQRSLAFPNPTPASIRPRATWQIDLLYCGTENQDNTLSQIPRKTRKQVSSLSYNMPHVIYFQNKSSYKKRFYLTVLNFFLKNRIFSENNSSGYKLSFLTRQNWKINYI